MAVQYLGDSNPIAGTSSATPDLSGFTTPPLPGDHALLLVVHKPSTITLAPPAGWDLAVPSVVVGSGSTGGGTGPLRLTVFRQDVPEGTWTLPTINLGTSDVISVGLIVYRTAPGEALQITASSGSDTTADTTWSVTGATVLPFEIGDVCLVFGGVTAQSPAFASSGIVIPGVTVGTVNNPWSTSTNLGNDLRSFAYRTTVVSGGGSAGLGAQPLGTSPLGGGATPGPPIHTAAMSTATNATGGALFLRLHAVPAVTRGVGAGAAGGGAGSVAATVVHSAVATRGVGAAGQGAGSAALSLDRAVLIDTVSAAGEGAGSAELLVRRAAVHDLTVGAAGEGYAAVEQTRLCGVRAAGAAGAGAGGLAAVSLYRFDVGAAGVGAVGSAAVALVRIPRPPPRTAPRYTLSLDTLLAGGQFDGNAPVVGGVEYVLSGLTGWWGSAATRTDRTPRLHAAGSYRRPAFKDVRSVEITVTATAVDGDRAARARTMRQAERRLAAICCDPDRLYPIHVADQDGVTSAYVELDGEIVHQLRDGLDYSAIFSIPVVALDPRRLAAQWSSAVTAGPTGGTGGVIAEPPGVRAIPPGVTAGTAARLPAVTVSATGTAPRLPLVFEVNGPASDLTVLDDAGGSVLGFRGELGPGASVWINADDQPAHDVPGAPDVIPARGAMLSDGSNARSAVRLFGSWPRLRPDTRASYSLVGGLSSAVRFAVHTRDAWI